MRDNAMCLSAPRHKRSIFISIIVSKLLGRPKTTATTIMPCRKMRVLLLLRFCLFTSVISGAFVSSPWLSRLSDGTSRIGLIEQRPARRVPPLDMVRNIDLPEALVFYGRHIFRDDATERLLPGVETLIKECRDINTPVVVMMMTEEEQREKDYWNNNHNEGVLVYDASTHLPPNPRALYECINSLTIQPRGFGGSSGFGRKERDPERSPLFQHTVVLCDSVDACRAARNVGARVLCCSDNDLADAVLATWDEIYSIDDIATPGSFWLNPPHPKDDEGNRIDIYEIMEYYESDERTETRTTYSERLPMMGDEDVDRILADLDSL